MKNKFEKFPNSHTKEIPKIHPRQKAQEKLYTRIQSGIYKGKKLLLPSLQTTRSTKNIVKACVFNVLQKQLQGGIFIEAFGGSALMAALALSNGAVKAYAIELDKKAYHIALHNAKMFNGNLIVLNGDTFKLLGTLIEKLQNAFVLYFDPPFHIRQGFEDVYERIYTLIKKLDLHKAFSIIIEHSSNVKTPQILEHFTRTKLKKFGTTSLSFYYSLNNSLQERVCE